MECHSHIMNFCHCQGQCELTKEQIVDVVHLRFYFLQTQVGHHWMKYEKKLNQKMKMAWTDHQLILNWNLLYMSAHDLMKIEEYD